MNEIRCLLGVASLLIPLVEGGCGPDAPASPEAESARTEPLSVLNESSITAKTRPVLDSISPHRAANRGGMAMILSGRNFVAGATVQIAGTNATSSVLSSTTIAVTLPGLRGKCGLVPVRIQNPTGEHALRSDLFTLMGAFGYLDPIQYPVVSYANEIAVADFNTDGHPDLVIGTLGEGGKVSYLAGRGDGSFRPAQSVAAGGVPISVLAADFNGDGNPDLAVSDWLMTGTGAGHVLLGKGHGGFVGPPFGATKDFTALEEIYRLKSVDLNSDGKADLLTIGEGSIGALLGKGDGTFMAHLDTRRTTRPWDVAAGDLNGDGHPDIAIANRALNTVSVLLGKGDGTFMTGSEYATDKAPIFVALADVDRDGKLDVVTGNALRNRPKIKFHFDMTIGRI